MNEFNQNAAKDIKNKSSNIYDTAKDTVTSAYYDTKPKAEELLEKVSDAASNLYESGKETLIQADGYIEDSVAYVSDSIRRQPLVSVLMAAGIGYLFAKFFK
jgi:ElaB/YqjD/DUF883 family membrane-anchored ribosome-binding protein